MALDTVSVRSPPIGEGEINQLEAQFFRRSGVEMATGHERYVIFTGELESSADARIGVVIKRKEYVVDRNGRPVEVECDPYLLVEASVHKMQLGHNIYGGPTNFLDACRELITLIEKLLEVELPRADLWTVRRVDVALVFRVSEEGCKEFFAGMKNSNFPRRGRGKAFYNMGFYFPGKTTTLKAYHKGTEFSLHDKARLRGFYSHYFKYKFGKSDLKNNDRLEKKIQALQRLANNRLRFEVEIHAPKLEYDFGKCPRVDEVSDAYLQEVFDREVEKLLREGKQGMDSVRTNRAVLRRLKDVYGDLNGQRLHGFWSMLSTEGDEFTRSEIPRASFYRYRKQLEDAGVSWRNTDLKVIANDGALPFDFAPIRSDRRLCFLPARNREEYQVSRKMLQAA